jgi:kynurenine formamidase
MDMGSMGSMGDEEDIDVDIDDEEPIDGEMAEGDVIGVYSDIDKQRNEMSEEDKVNSHVSKMMDEIFAESKIDKVLTSYFQISESENKQKKQKLVETKKVAVNSIKRLSETIEQELAAEFIVRENSNYKLVGKTNKKNLVFEHNGEQIRVTTKGEVL